MTSAIAQTGDDVPIHPGDGVVPILHQVGYKRLKVVGTGFYLTRYGLVATAKHVIEEMTDQHVTALDVGYVAHLNGKTGIILRHIKRAHLLKSSDVAVLQVDNYVDRFPENALMNLRPNSSTSLPAQGERLTTFAYPENKILDFNGPDIPEIHGDYFQGGFLRYVANPEHPFMRFPYLETTVELRSGASGGPVFDSSGSIVAVNCRGWDFRGSEHEGSNLSYLVPIDHLLDLEVDMSMLPPNSWEMAQIPEDRKGKPLAVRELAQYGHVLMNQRGRTGDA